MAKPCPPASRLNASTGRSAPWPRNDLTPPLTRIASTQMRTEIPMTHILVMLGSLSHFLGIVRAVLPLP